MPYKNKSDAYANMSKYRDRNKTLLLTYLSDKACLNCGEDDIIVLDFDHLPEFEKKFDIAKAVSTMCLSWKKILEEINKCEIVCANCHRKRTARRGNFYRHKHGTLG